MEIAARWYTTPMRLVGGSKLLWYVRMKAVRDCEIRRNHKREDEIKRQLEAAREGR